jgi:hypothetical protein
MAIDNLSLTAGDNEGVFKPYRKKVRFFFAIDLSAPQSRKGDEPIRPVG